MRVLQLLVLVGGFFIVGCPTSPQSEAGDGGAGPDAGTPGGRDGGGAGDGGTEGDAGSVQDAGENEDAGGAPDAGNDGGQDDVDSGVPDAGALKPLPSGVYKQIGGIRSPTDNPVQAVSVTDVVHGFGLSVPWDLCGDDEACLFDAIRATLDSAEARGLSVALAIADGANVPPSVKAGCELFSFTFRNVTETMCLAWDPVYLAEKTSFVRRLGAAFDGHPALSYFYFTGPCSTNGVEGHCRVEQNAYTQAGYTSTRLVDAYTEIMRAYVEAFPTTPLAFEVHAIFDDDSPWSDLWQEFGPSGRVGVAAWWCAERLSVAGAETASVFSLVQLAASTSFSVCQTVGSMSQDPWRFSDASLGLDYGTQDAFTSSDVEHAFTDTMDWIEGQAVHAGQAAPIVPFTVLEAWSADADEPTFQSRLAAH